MDISWILFGYEENIVLWNLLQFPVSNIYRRVVTQIFPINLIRRSLWNSELRDSTVDDMFMAVCKHVMGNLLKNVTPSESGKLVWEHESMRWEATCLMYPELSVYNDNIKKIDIHSWWAFYRTTPERPRGGRLLLLFNSIDGCSHLYYRNATKPRGSK